MNTDCLFVHQGHCIGVQDFVDALRSVGVRRGDTMFVHSGLGGFGKLGRGYDKNALCRAVIGACKEAVSEEGTLALPTFTYAYCVNRVYDPAESPSEVGVLGEVFRKEPDVIRSSHPIFSIAAWGAGARELTDVGVDAFGDGSFLQGLHRRDAVQVFLGARLRHSCTFVHYLEQAQRVPYRFMKDFPGVIKRGGREEHVNATYWVRPLDGSVDSDGTPLSDRLSETGKLVRVAVGGSGVEGVRSSALYDEGVSMLQRDPYVFAVWGGPSRQAEKRRGS